LPAELTHLRSGYRYKTIADGSAGLRAVKTLNMP
jgi:hypothetical protein